MGRAKLLTTLDLYQYGGIRLVLVAWRLWASKAIARAVLPTGWSVRYVGPGDGDA